MTTTPGLPPVAWHISSKSEGNGGNCVEAGPVLDGSGRVAVRHSHQPDGTTLVYTGRAWTAFLDAVRAGGFDLP